MEQRTFTQPNVRIESGIGFCTPSWQRQRKYVSLNHWLTTKALTSKRKQKDQKTARYKLFEIGHYAGSVILEIGLPDSRLSTVAVTAGGNADVPVQYYGIDTNAQSIVRTHAKFKQRKLADNSVFFKGSLADFRNVLPVTPTMVVINRRENVSGILNHLALFLAAGTPVLVQNWFQSRADLRQPPKSDAFEFCGRFGESILYSCKRQSCKVPTTYCEREFAQIRQRFTVDEQGVLVQKRIDGSANYVVSQSDKKWPFKNDPTAYPATLPDGSPWPKISVVTPTYNQGQYIAETIASVKNQNYPNLEYIVVDAQSTDQTPQILDNYKHCIDFLICEPDEGQSDAINKGMGYASGELLTWLNSDDLFPPGTLYAMAMAFWKSKADMVAGTVQFLEQDTVSGEHLTSCENGPLQLAELLDLDGCWLQGRFFYQPEVMFTRDLWQRSGGYVNKELYFSMDYDMWVRFAIAGAKLHVIGRPTAIYRVHDGQKTAGDYEPELRAVNRRYCEKYGFQDSQSLAPAKKYKATFVNDLGVRYGAGIAHGRLRDAMSAAGHSTDFVHAKADIAAESKSATDLLEEIEASEPDLVVIGNVHHTAAGTNIVDAIVDRWPSMFVMHDMWLSTGRCAYAGTCEKFKSGCDAACPTPTEYPALNPEQIQSEFNSKLQIISQPNQLIVAGNSDWTQATAEQSVITSKSRLTRIKYGLPTHVFKPRDQSMCREILGLPDDAFIVLFGSVNNNDERKGARHLFEALNRLQLDNVVPVCLGHASDVGDMYPGTIAMGYSDDLAQNAMIYSAADVFVGPSLEEAFGQVFIEAAACGTPSVGYPVGGAQEALTHGVTGRVASEVAPAALAEEISRLYSDTRHREQLAVWGRIEIENEWSLRSCFHKFNTVLKNNSELLGFTPTQIEFDPAATAGIVRTSGRQPGLLEKVSTSLTTVQGFADEEPIELSDGTLTSAQWVTANGCSFNVFIDNDERYKVLAECLNPVPQQQMSIYCNDELIHTIDLKAGQNFLMPESVCLASGLASGQHKFRIEFSGSIAEQNGSRDLAMMFANLRLVAFEGIETTKRLNIFPNRVAA